MNKSPPFNLANYHWKGFYWSKLLKINGVSLNWIESTKEFVLPHCGIVPLLSSPTRETSKLVLARNVPLASSSVWISQDRSLDDPGRSWRILEDRVHRVRNFNFRFMFTVVRKQMSYCFGFRNLSLYFLLLDQQPMARRIRHWWTSAHRPPFSNSRLRLSFGR